MYRSAKKLAKRLRRGKANPPEAPARLSSFPFLSGDTFRSMAGVVWERGRITHERNVAEEVFFVEADTALGVDQLDAFIDSRGGAVSPDSLVVVIHNGDTPPDRDTLVEFTKRTKQVYCVNVSDDIEGVTPIPIGLENVWFNKSGRLRYYLDRPPRRVEPDNFDYLVLSSFSVGTNRAKRQPVASLMESSRHGHHGMVWKSGEFRDVISRSLFVISPPGNGADAHRTWEAVYLGAVPVVEKDSLASSLTSELPILAVNHYEEFLDMSDDELLDVYVDIRQRRSDKAYAPYWVSRIMSNPGASSD
jgi:hypothetical protein